MPEKKKWYQFFVTVENEEKKEERLEETGKIDNYPEISTPTGQFDEPPSFEQIYQTIGIKIPNHGFNIYKVEEMLRSVHLKDMNNDSKKNAVLVALEAIKVPIEEIIQDAINRDKALDSYEKYEEKKLKEFESRKSDENKKIQEEIERFFNEKREQIQANDRLVQQGRERFKGWQDQKRAEEQKIFETLKYFTPEHPIGSIYASQSKAQSEQSEESSN